jgi:hypothetical protein
MNPSASPDRDQSMRLLYLFLVTFLLGTAGIIGSLVAFQSWLGPAMAMLSVLALLAFVLLALVHVLAEADERGLRADAAEDAPVPVAVAPSGRPVAPARVAPV